MAIRTPSSGGNASTTAATSARPSSSSSAAVGTRAPSSTSTATSMTKPMSAPATARPNNNVLMEMMATPTARQLGMGVKGLDHPAKVPVGAKSPQALIAAQGGTAYQLGKLSPDKGFVHVDAHGKPRAFASPNLQGYRTMAQQVIGSVKDRDVDHVLNQASARKLGMMSGLAAIDPSSNRAHGPHEKKPAAGQVADGVRYATTRELRKLEGFKPAKLDLGMPEEQAVIFGYAGGFTVAQKGRIARNLGWDNPKAVTGQLKPIAPAADATGITPQRVGKAGTVRKV